MQNNYYKYIRKNIPIQKVCKKFGIPVFGDGSNNTCNCPFHEDTHPSMSLYSESNTAYCFSCKKIWDNFQFVEEKLNIGFDEAVKWFEKEFPELSSKKTALLKDIHMGRSGDAYDIAYNIYSKMTEREEQQLEVFADSRGYKRNDLETKGIFFADDSKVKKALNINDDIEELHKLMNAELLFQLPMQDRDITPKYEDYYSQKGIIITIRDTSGNIAGFAQRAIKESRSKYRFTKKLPKGNLLYRLNEVKAKILRMKDDRIDLYLVEGMFDALRLEVKGKMAVAVLGSHLMENQALELEKCLLSSGKVVFLHIFMDNDEAGRKGNYKTLQNLWKSCYFRSTYIDIIFPHDRSMKDPDDYYKKYSIKEGIKYHPFDFLTRYFLGDEFLYEGIEKLEEEYEKSDIENKILFLNKILHIMPRNAWKEVFNVYENWGMGQDYFYKKIKNYVEGIREKQETPLKAIKPENLSQFQRAMQLARTSYDKESLPLDDASWNRIAACADAFFKYFQELFENNQHIDTPLLSMYFPKKAGEERKKAIFIHERLIMQQYILDELLGVGYGGYEQYIPAVRFSANSGHNHVYTTGFGEQADERETVSFAYQVNMDALCGNEIIQNGMFRNYYDCWKEYIGFIQDGIERLESEKVYRIKLDIEKFYDNIPVFTVRKALTDCVKEALKADNNKFLLFQTENGNSAERLVDWILEEIYEPCYYDAETGGKCRKEYETTGIPQGPNLSAYLANVILFDLDREVSDYVREVNQNAQEGKIRVCYARYVDDMVVISSSADVLLHIKNLISSMLYDVGLSLSPKTDQADNIAKEDAYDWTISERGGLGVSAIYDLPDNTLDNILDEYEEYEVTDRRKALQLLQSVTRSIDFAGDSTLAVDEKVIDIFFQTRDVKFNDIVRISEILLHFAVTLQLDGNLWEKFCFLWNNGKKCSLSDSLFQCEKIEGFAFIEACNRALKRQPYEIRKVDEFESWKVIQENISEFWSNQNLVEQMIKTEFTHGILQKNCWVIKLRLAELLKRIKNEKKTYLNIWDKVEESNEYCRRWIYALAEESQEVYQKLLMEGWKYIKENRVLYAFHFATAMLPCMKAIREFKEIQAVFISSEFKSQITYMGNGVLGQCMKCWFDSAEQEDKPDEQILRIALLVLVNCLRDVVKADILGEIGNLRKYIFFENNNLEVECIPAVQGAEYPGLIAMSMKECGDFEIDHLQRAQFVSENTIIPRENWNPLTYHAELDSYQLTLESGFQSLDTYFKGKANENLETVMDRVLMVYEKLWPCIKNIQEMYPDMRLILSKRNVFIKQESKNMKLQIVSYLVKQENSGSGVMTERENGVFVLEPLNGNGDYFWQAGCLLRDASGFEKIRLKYLDGQKKDQDIQIVEMMEYTFHRLTGAAVNKNSRYRGTHSYAQSVTRSIERTRIFLKSTKIRSILLEDNRIIDSFISSRMGNESYMYLPAVCSYSTGIWAKAYLRKNFQYLMSLADGKNVDRKEEYPKRRVPRIYLFLADCIRSIHHIDSLSEKEFQGIKVLEAGLRANAVLVHLRMQALEIIESLDKQEKARLEAQVDNLPFGNLGLDGSETFNTGHREMASILRRFLRGENEKEIGYLTHLGWLLILEWLLENENCMGKKLHGEIRIFAEKIICDSEEEGGTFPFEHMTGFFNMWSYDETKEKVEILKLIDRDAKISVEERKEEKYYQEIDHKRNVTVNLDQRIEKPYYFLTYSKLDNNPMPVEQDTDEPDKKCYTLSRRNGKIVGVSTIENSLGQLLQRWEKESKPSSDLGEKKEKRMEEKISDANLNSQNTILTYEDESNHENDFVKDLVDIKKKQEQSFESRKKKFGHTDRIAFFQFRTECSYYHPINELCKNFECKNQYGYSCHEFRRRKLLKEVFEICDELEVEILLLPEYSVRPETVIWMYKEISDNEYGFSVWAGTFRIPYGYQFEKKYFSNEKLGDKQYYHAAILPVISKNKDNDLKILCRHIKKYPSIALDEDINPCSLKDSNNNFDPVMKSISDYGEARSHVTELICAELFALSSPGNMVSFGKETFKLYMRYMTGKPYEANNIKTEERDYLKKMLEDVETYGKYISLYRDDRSVERKSILLVPACTTRAVDYYVLGQANYLGSGGNMVFCNCTGNGMNGGSCFIGQDSWDKWNSLEESDFMRKTSIYHGINPGIYKQGISRPDRGALGKREQALVVCDVMPELERRKPNPESMCRALELVAHIPILEENVHAEECLKKCICKKDAFLCSLKENEEKKSRVETLHWISTLNQALTTEGGRATSAEDTDPCEIANNLICLGNKYESEWLAERGRQYERGHRLYPRHWIPETAVDWRYVEIDYAEFLSTTEVRDACMLQMPDEKEKKNQAKL